MTQDLAPKRRVLVTGATGFLGKFVIREMKGSAFEVIETSKSLGYDLRNEAEALTSVWLSKPDIIVHLARTPAQNPDAQASVYRDTVLMDMNILHAAAIQRAKIILVFPPLIASPLSMLSGEAQAKNGLQFICGAYASQYGLEIRTLLFSELYGPFMRPQEGFLDVLTLVNTFILAQLKGEGVVILPGTGEAERQLLCVTDAAKAVVKACETPLGPGFTSFTGKDKISEKLLVEHVMKACNYEGVVEWDGEDSSPFRPPVLEASDAETVLGVKAQMLLEHGIATVAAMRMEGINLKEGKKV